MYFEIFLFCAVLINVHSQEVADTQIVNISQGPVRGYRNQEHGFYSYYSIPFGTVNERFKAASPPPTWTEPFDAVDRGIVCPQGPASYINLTTKTVQEDCLVLNVFVPQTNQTNLPVLFDVHGGAFNVGLADAASYNEFVSLKNVIVVTHNYRLGIIGFMCLGTEKIPGNAGMKDMVLALRWVQENIGYFGGNPNDVTLTGCSAGGSAIDLLLLSKQAEGLFHKAIVDSGSSLVRYGFQTDPIEVAKWHARLYNFTINVDDLTALEQFYLTQPYDVLISVPSTCGPCVERDVGQEMFLDEAPYTILRRGDFIKYPTLYGVADLERLFLTTRFEALSQMMNNDFVPFLPGDLEFSSEEEKRDVAETVRYSYFGNQSVSMDTFWNFVDYQSDVVFVTAMLRSVKLVAEAGHDKIYFYEYSFYEDDSSVQGAVHCAQAAAARDEDTTNISEDYRRVKTLVRDFWHAFIGTGNPAFNVSSIPSWPPIGPNRSPHLSVGRSIELRGEVMPKRGQLWDAIYDKHYIVPSPPSPGSASLAQYNTFFVTMLLIIYNVWNGLIY